MNERLRDTISHIEALQQFHFERSWGYLQGNSNEQIIDSLRASAGAELPTLENIADLGGFLGRRVFDAEKFADSQIWKNRLEQLLGEPIREVDPNYFSPNESLLNTELLWNGSGCVEAAFNRMKIRFPENVALGTLHEHEVNAQANTCPAGGKFIVVNSGLFTLLSSLCQILILALPEASRDPETGYMSFEFRFEPERISGNSHLKEVFASAIEDYASSAPRSKSLFPFSYVKDSDRARLFLDFFSVVIVFVMAHEYAHVFLGHTYKEGYTDELRHRRFPGGQSEDWSLSHMQHQELVADASAWIVCVNAFRPRLPLVSIFVGIELFFVAALLIEATHGPIDSPGHLERDVRVGEMVALVKDFLPDDADSIFHHMDDVRRLFGTLCDQ